MSQDMNAGHEPVKPHKDCPACHDKPVQLAVQSSAKAPVANTPVSWNVIHTQITGLFRSGKQIREFPPPRMQLALASPVILNVRLIC